MKFSASSTLLLVATALSVSAALGAPAESSSINLLKRGGCSQGVHVCCGSTSVGCSGNVCKACCGNQCGCFYARGSKCSSDPNVVPCVDVSKPDFAMTNGQCKASGAPSQPQPSGGSSSSSNSFCNRLSPGLRRIFGC